LLLRSAEAKPRAKMTTLLNCNEPTLLSIKKFKSCDTCSTTRANRSTPSRKPSEAFRPILRKLVRPLLIEMASSAP